MGQGFQSHFVFIYLPKEIGIQNILLYRENFTIFDQRSKDLEDLRQPLQDAVFLVNEAPPLGTQRHRLHP